MSTSYDMPVRYQLCPHFISNSHLSKNFFNQVNKATESTAIFKPKGCGGRLKVPDGQAIVCHFSQGHAMITKNLVIDYFDKFFRN